MVPQNLINESFPLGGHSKKSVKDQFLHLGDGNYSVTLKILEHYLAFTGIPKRSHTADLIMFMEKSFKYKYYDDEYKHYQYIMPCAACKEGDSLSEKLIRCAHKDSFGKRFSNIGTTRRVSGDLFQQGTIDFAGLPYYRLIDTLDNNKNWFFRNDTRVLELFQEAYEFNEKVPYKSRRKTARSVQRNREWCTTKQGVVYNETRSGVQQNRERLHAKQGVAHTNTNTQEYHQEEKQEDIHDKTAFCVENIGTTISSTVGNTKYPKNYIKRYGIDNTENACTIQKAKTVLTLVKTQNTVNSIHCKGMESSALFFEGAVEDAVDCTMATAPFGFNGNCATVQHKDLIMAKSSDKGRIRLTAATTLPTLPTAEVKNLDAYMVKNKEYNGVSDVTGYTLLKLYRDAVIANDLSTTLEIPKDKADMAKANNAVLAIYNLFCISYPKEVFPHFMNEVMAEWGSLKARLTRDNVWKDFAPYPELGWLKWAFPHVLAWYTEGVAAALSATKAKTPEKSGLTEVHGSLQSKKGVIMTETPEKPKNSKSVAGYTYVGGYKYDSLGLEMRTFEDDWVTAAREGDFANVEFFKEVLQKKAVSYEASEKRVASLLNQM